MSIAPIIAMYYIRYCCPTVNRTALESFILWCLCALIQEAKYHHYKIMYKNKNKKRPTTLTSLEERSAHFDCDKVNVKAKQNEEKKIRQQKVTIAAAEKRLVFGFNRSIGSSIM